MSVKSSQAAVASNGILTNPTLPPEDHKDYMNLPYSRTQDTLGAAMATPSYYFKDGLSSKKTVKELFYAKRDLSLHSGGASYTAQTRPSTSGHSGVPRVPHMNM